MGWNGMVALEMLIELHQMLTQPKMTTLIKIRWPIFSCMLKSNRLLISETNAVI